HGRVLEHDHGERHGDAAVSGRLGGSVAGSVWFQPGAGRDLCGRGSAGALSRVPRGAQTRYAHLPGIRRGLSADRGEFPAADREAMAAAAVLVLRQDGYDSVCLYLGPRHPAAVPLRPIDGLHVEVPVPGGDAEPARDRPSGCLGIVMPITPDVILFVVFA